MSRRLTKFALPSARPGPSPVSATRSALAAKSAASLARRLTKFILPSARQGPSHQCRAASPNLLFPVLAQDARQPYPQLLSKSAATQGTTIPGRGSELQRTPRAGPSAGRRGACRWRMVALSAKPKSDFDATQDTVDEFLDQCGAGRARNPPGSAYAHSTGYGGPVVLRALRVGRSPNFSNAHLPPWRGPRNHYATG